MDSLNVVTALRGLILDHLLEIHTTLPARVVAVDYGAKSVLATSITKNTRTATDEEDYPIFHDVPIFMNGGGNARITFPVKTGDIGVVVFTERDPSNALQTTGDSSSSASMIMPCGLYPIMFIPKIALGSDSSKAIDENNIELSNDDKSTLTLSPDGEIIAESVLGGKITVNSGVTITDGSGTLTVSDGKLNWTGGEVSINGLTISKDGLLTDANGLAFATHTHKIENVETGDSEIESLKPTN